MSSLSPLTPYQRASLESKAAASSVPARSPLWHVLAMLKGSGKGMKIGICVV